METLMRPAVPGWSTQPLRAARSPDIVERTAGCAVAGAVQESGFADQAYSPTAAAGSDPSATSSRSPWEPTGFSTCLLFTLRGTPETDYYDIV